MELLWINMFNDLKKPPVQRHLSQCELEPSCHHCEVDGMHRRERHTLVGMQSKEDPREDELCASFFFLFCVFLNDRVCTLMQLNKRWQSKPPVSSHLGGTHYENLAYFLLDFVSFWVVSCFWRISGKAKVFLWFSPSVWLLICCKEQFIPIFKILSWNVLFLFFAVLGFWTQGLMLPFVVFGIVKKVSHKLFCWPWTSILLTSPSWVARIIGVSQWHPAVLKYF
jgi:hypothetical protein